MWSSGLTPNEQSAYEIQLRAGTRIWRTRGQLYDVDGRPLALPVDVDDGEVISDITNLGKEATHAASLTLWDTDRRLPRVDDATWYSWSLSLVTEEFVPALDRWIHTPLFFGPVQDVGRSGGRVELDCASKDVQHLAPHELDEPMQIPPHLHVHRAIRYVLEERGETRFDLDFIARRLNRRRPLWAGVEPWAFVSRLAESVDKILIYRGDGTARLKSLPSQPSWRFEPGDDCTLIDHPQQHASIDPVRNSFVVVGQDPYKATVSKKTFLSAKADPGDVSIFVQDNQTFFEVDAEMTIGKGARARTRKVTSRSGTEIFFAGNPLDIGYEKGARVLVEFKEDRSRPLVGRARIGQSNPLSDDRMTGGRRPRVDRIDRPGVHSLKNAQELAEKRRDRSITKTEQQLALSSVPIWPLEVGDIALAVEINERSRIQRISKPVKLGGSMEINWQGKRPPYNERHKGKR